MKKAGLILFLFESPFTNNNDNYVTDFTQLASTKHSDNSFPYLGTHYENGNISYLFTNKQGNTVLERQVANNEFIDTYYIYDDYNNRICVLPPLAVDATSRSGVYTFAPGGTLDKYVYLYKYDHRNRCIEKKLPGCKPIYMVYDKADHLILLQDGNQRARGVWTVSKYDCFDRLVYTYEAEINDTHEPLISLYAQKVAVEDFTIGTQANPMQNTGYSCNLLNVSSKRILTVYYYDNYSFLNSGLMSSSDASALAFKNIGYGALCQSAKGKRTGVRTYLLNAPGVYIATSYFYDTYGNLIQRRCTNHKGGYDNYYCLYTFTGKPLLSLHEHSVANGKLISELYTNSYDHAGRLKDIKYAVSDGGLVVICSNTYDELGRLASKKLGNIRQTTFNYRYNIRNWLTSINSPVFKETLLYESYNGNISQMKWATQGESKEHLYIFSYDEINRMKKANYGEYFNTTCTLNSNYNVEIGGYDKQGNILQLMRRGVIMPRTISGRIVGGNDMNYGLIDNLTYSYKGNQLTRVADASTTEPYYKDAMHFTDGTDEDVEYTYDDNGNMIYDKNKGIESIAYNMLNLPEKISQNKNIGLHMQGTPTPYTQESIIHSYDANGTMLQKAYSTEKNYIMTPGMPNSGGMIGFSQIKSKVDYCDNFIYENDTLSKILIPEGYISVKNGTFIYHYYAKDHQGNNRVVVDQGGVVKQVNHYYPFGALFGASSGGAEQGYKYNGKELERMHGLDWYNFGKRMQDPVLGRFSTMDRLCEKYYSLSPYQYGANNPVNNIDVNGDSIKISVKEAVIDANGNSTIKSTDFNCVIQSDGTYKFLDGDGKEYTGDKSFIANVTDALNTLGSKPAGKNLANKVVNSDKKLGISRSNGRNKTLPEFNEVGWNPNSKKGGIDQNGKDTRPPFIGLGHEFAHIVDIWEGTYDHKLWTIEDGEPIPNAEKSATHVENQLRSEHELPLRTHYKGEKTPIINPANNSSLHFRKIESINNSLVPTIPYMY